MTESQVLQAFSKGRPVLPPLEVKVTGTELRARGAPTRVDAAVAVSWDGDRYEFAAEVKARSVPKVLTEAIAEARRCAEETGRLPMVVVPYLRTEQLDEEDRRLAQALGLGGAGGNDPQVLRPHIDLIFHRHPAHDRDV